jgi:uncharacterized protein (TIGR03437 family)
VIRLLYALIPFTALAFPLGAQSFDTSGTSGLAGAYFYRYVVFSTTASTGAFSEGCSVTGVMTFDGKGSYSTSNTQRYDTAGSSSTACPAPSTGTYAVQSNGLAQLDNPIFAATIYGSFSQPVLAGSSTEDGYYDLFVAIQAPSGGVSNGTMNGRYLVGTLDYTNAQNSLAREGWFPLSANGSGSIAGFTVTGSAANLGNSTIMQNISGATYSLSGNGSGTLNLGSASQSQLVSGTKALYISADGNYILGGSTTGVDVLFGFKAPAGGGSNSLLNGTYFLSGIEAYLPPAASSFLDSFYGAINTNGSGIQIWHQRFDDIVDGTTYDNTFNASVNIGSDGTYYDGVYTTLAGNNGLAVMQVGSGQQYSLVVGVKAPAYTPTSGVWINPIGITNSANYTPITNSYAAGELVNIYGNFGVAAQVAQTLPIPTTLGGVQVMVNGIAAPVYSVGQNQITALIPFAVPGQSFAVFQVLVNGSTSNTVTVYSQGTTPGIYTLNQNGIGASAILHSNFTTVTSSSPATPGETVLLFLNGLGVVNPQTGDGAAGPANPLSKATTTVSVYLDDFSDPLAQATVAFAGLAPGFPGLYQVNFTVPTSGLKSGNIYVQLETDDAVTEMSTISLTGFPQASAAAVSGRMARHQAQDRTFGHRTKARAHR